MKRNETFDTFWQIIQEILKSIYKYVWEFLDEAIHGRYLNHLNIGRPPSAIDLIYRFLWYCCFFIIDSILNEHLS